MVEVDPAIALSGPDGPVTLLQAFEGRRQLIAYFHMWFTGHSAAEQCEGCTYFNGQVRELSYLHSRDVTYGAIVKTCGSVDVLPSNRERVLSKFRQGRGGPW